MSGRTWFITGVSGGIGQALAAAALQRGDQVVGTVRREEDRAAFEALSPNIAHGVLLDVADAAAVPRLVDTVLAKFRQIDVVVNNAGQSLWGAIEETNVLEAKALFDVNFFGPMAIMQAFLPHFRATGKGLFVNLSSGCGLFPVPGIGLYCSTKFALEALSEVVSYEAAAFGVRVMLVEPGAVATRFLTHGTAATVLRHEAYEELTGGSRAEMEEKWSAGAIAPEEVAQKIVAAVDSGFPPLRVPVGPGMREAAIQRFETLRVAISET